MLIIYGKERTGIHENSSSEVQTSVSEKGVKNHIMNEKDVFQSNFHSWLSEV